ncbi:MAG: helix-turn-helix transcriptional regulator [Lachnospiraceae bacterium]|jgi:DNA-binding CsgD family transcriptional regulator|nr:helix-turn-helix transcriptional regulator [Lachnospiraceae bacterium]
METLKNTEWLMIHKILLEMYDIRSLDVFAPKVLRLFRTVIPCSMGYFMLFDADGGIIAKQSAFADMDPGVFALYMSDYYEKDYLKYMFDISTRSFTYRDTDILDDAFRKKTPFYREFLRPNMIPYGAGAVLCIDGKPMGILNFFRNESMGDFSDKDLFVLDIFRDHLSGMLMRLQDDARARQASHGAGISAMAAAHGLTGRESEVLGLVLEGFSNIRLADGLHISESTAKKHVHSIFSKTGVRTRSELRTVVQAWQESHLAERAEAPPTQGP